MSKLCEIETENIQIVEKSKTNFQITFNNINNKKLLLSADETDKKLEVDIDIDSLIKYFKQTKRKPFSVLNLEENKHAFTIDKMSNINNKLVWDISISKIKKNSLSITGVIKDAVFYIKSVVPVVDNIKGCNPVDYTNKITFKFVSWNYYNDYKSGQIITLKNKGAIFWYYPTSTVTNDLLKVQYIMVNTPSVSFVPNADCVVSLEGAVFYYGWYANFKSNPTKYVDFYEYQSAVNNYVYVFTVLRDNFFAKTRFEKVRSVKIL